MIIIPGFVIALFTFPGVIIHEAAHQLFCRLCKLAVYRVCYFQLANPSGYVIHEKSEDFTKVFLVSMGPFFVNSLLCVLFCSAAFLPVGEFEVGDLLAFFFYWLGLSIGMHAFPSTEDLKHIWNLAPVRARQGSLLAIISLPMVAVLFVLNFARVIWADLGYGIAIGVLVPIALFKALFCIF